MGQAYNTTRTTSEFQRVGSVTSLASNGSGNAFSDEELPTFESMSSAEAAAFFQHDQRNEDDL